MTYRFFFFLIPLGLLKKIEQNRLLTFLGAVDQIVSHIGGI